MKKLIIGNWKMNPQDVKESRRLFDSVSQAARGLRNVETVICPPFPYLYTLRPTRYTLLGAQDVFWKPKGAFTGEISTKMLKNSKVSYVIIGHSERRKHLGETDQMVNKKVLAALEGGLKVILCIGELLQEKKAGKTKAIISRQLRQSLKGARSILQNSASLIITYEPVWAISTSGTGLVETPFSANEAAQFIRQELIRLLPNKIAKNVRIIYGGSVNSSRIFGFLVMSEISGALVGGASLDTKDFSKILQIANVL